MTAWAPPVTWAPPHEVGGITFSAPFLVLPQGSGFSSRSRNASNQVVRADCSVRQMSCDGQCRQTQGPGLIDGEGAMGSHMMEEASVSCRDSMNQISFIIFRFFFATISHGLIPLKKTTQILHTLTLQGDDRVSMPWSLGIEVPGQKQRWTFTCGHEEHLCGVAQQGRCLLINLKEPANWIASKPMCLLMLFRVKDVLSQKKSQATLLGHYESSLDCGVITQRN